MKSHVVIYCRNPSLSLGRHSEKHCYTKFKYLNLQRRKQEARNDRLMVKTLFLCSRKVADDGADENLPGFVCTSFCSYFSMSKTDSTWRAWWSWKNLPAQPWIKLSHCVLCAVKYYRSKAGGSLIYQRDRIKEYMSPSDWSLPLYWMKEPFT